MAVATFIPPASAIFIVGFLESPSIPFYISSLSQRGSVPDLNIKS